MDVGIGLPNALLDVDGPELVVWAQRAEQRGFSVLGTIGRVAYGSHEELIALAGAAGATERIELMTTVLVAPPRQAVLLAKQAATLQALSGGRFRLGLGIGGRDDDWLALGEEPKNKGQKLEALIATCRSVWAGRKPEGALLPVGPEPPHLPIVLGGYSDSAFRRAGRLADAFVAGPMPPEAVAGVYDAIKAAATEAQRDAPALYAARYVAIGDDVADEADRNARSYYGFGGDALVQMVQDGILRSSDDVREALRDLEQAGVVELCLWPLARSVDQVDRVADAAL
ncbi:MAG TPA: LLM class flavin-dependent oxidoreductase [Acidimicrobiales bacterium]|nr:LLM class flavin-dependent oxidoreductase [Acidimicrobiales bacterium]